MTRYDIWKTASPPEYDFEDCCDDCDQTKECADCFCHATKEDIAAMKAEMGRD